MSWSIADRIEGLRREIGWTKRELARRSGIHEGHIYKICAGKRSCLEVETVRRLACAFGVSTDYLLGMDTFSNGTRELTG